MKSILTFFLINIFSIFNLFCQSEQGVDVNRNYYRAAFWNIENYFDSFTDSTSNYTEFNYDGDRHWNYDKYESKRTAIYKTIIAMGEWQPLSILGLAEIENEFVLRDLLANTPLKSMGYRIVHYESDDNRGIDVGLLYHPSQFEVLFSKKMIIRDKENPDFRTRDILYVKGLMGYDTLHVFINHWPSRYRGYMNSEPLRLLASGILKNATDSICLLNSGAAILIMGDFNDRAENESVRRLSNEDFSCQLFLLSLNCSNKDVKGTIKYQGKWDYFDHILVSKKLLEFKSGLVIRKESATIFAPDFLLEKDEKFAGIKPKRAFIGFKYNGGISDHLPVYVDFIHSGN